MISGITTRIISLPLRVKLALSIALAALVVLGVAFFAASRYSDDVQPITSILAQTLVAERANTLSAVVTGINASVSTAALNPTYIDAYAALRDASASPEARDSARRVIEDAFRRMLNDNPHFWQVRFVSPEGRVLLAANPVADYDDIDQGYLRALQGAVEVGGVYVGPITDTPAPNIDFVAVPTLRGQRLGYVVVSVDPAGRGDPARPSIYGALRSFSSQSGTLVFYLIGAGGRVESPFAERIVENAEAVSNALALAAPGQEPVSMREFISPLTGRQTQGAVYRVAALGRLLVAEAQVIHIGRSAEAGIFLIDLALVLAGALLVLAALWLFLDQTIARPVQRLSDMAMRAAEGRTIEKHHEGGDPGEQHNEIGALYRAFSALTGIAQQDSRLLETRVMQRTRDIEATREIGQIVSSLRDLDALLNRVVELIQERFESIYHAQVFLIDSTRQFAVLRASTGEAGAKLLARGHRLAVGSQSVIGRTTADGQPVVALDTETSVVHRTNDLLPETRAELALPLRVGSQIIGALDLQSKRPEAFTDADIRLFQGVADQLAVAIVNAQLFEESQARLNEIEDLNRRLLGEAWRGYEVARRRALPIRSRAGQPQAETWTELQRKAVETKSLQERFDTDTVTFAVPVILRDQVFGAVEWVVPRASYNENTRLLASELSARLAVSADNARLIEQSQRMADRERLVNQIASKLTSQTDVEQVLQLAVRELGQALRVPQTSIRLATIPTAQRESAERQPTVETVENAS